MQELPDPRKISLFPPSSSRSLDTLIQDFYTLQAHMRDDLHRHDPPIAREDLERLCNEVGSRIVFGQHAIVAQTTLQASGGYDWNKKNVLIYASGQDGWWRGEADLAAGVFGCKNVSLMEGSLIASTAAEEGLVNIGRENVVIVKNPSSLLFGREKVGIGYALLRYQHLAMHERAKATFLASIPSRLARLLGGKGISRCFTRIIPLSRIDERRHAVIYARSSSRMYWSATNLEEDVIFGLNKSGIPPKQFAEVSSESRFHLLSILERLHPGHNVYLAHNEGYPRYARRQILDVVHILHARYQTMRRIAEKMSVHPVADMQPEDGQT